MTRGAVKEGCVAVALCLLGVASITGDLINSTPLKAVAGATGASPAPKVFSAVNGLETYSTRFFVEWKDQQGESHQFELTPETNSRIKGPYVRRNIYGAALAYGPLLKSNERTREMLMQIIQFALCGDAPLLQELGIDVESIEGPVRVRLEPENPETLAPDLDLVLTVNCDE